MIFKRECKSFERKENEPEYEGRDVYFADLDVVRGFGGILLISQLILLNLMPFILISSPAAMEMVSCSLLQDSLQTLYIAEPRSLTGSNLNLVAYPKLLRQDFYKSIWQAKDVVGF
ncbi:hypothetical protein CBL_12408 [Carabus blaptoides fortunei]